MSATLENFYLNLKQSLGHLNQSLGLLPDILNSHPDETRLAALSATAIVVNTLVHGFLTTAFSKALILIAALVVFEEHLLVNAYCFFFHQNPNRLSNTEKVIIYLALALFNSFLAWNFVTTSAFPIFYRTVSQVTINSFALAQITMLFDFLTTY
ncbi:MAG: hypothetical protein WC371_01930 [Parachlamydiales bacterium]|jgi:hypothetical protein